MPAPDGEDSHLTVDTEAVGEGRYVVHLDGELDLAGAGRLDAQLEAIADPVRIVIDVDKVSFIDSGGLATLLAWRRRCSDRRVDFTLTPGTPAVRKIFEVTGLLDRLPSRGAQR
ncbi:MAG TPA: STAS domain-containing protein [Solirubrobacteraceae bacterium]|jgi:anti-anti-sigma factor|nr:STAS domain-containing protein [Solirubrobacteraceae bacterium]